MLGNEDNEGVHIRAMLIRLRIELFTAARALRGEDLEEFWKLIDDINAIRPTEKVNG